MLKRIGIILASLIVSGVFLWFALRDLPVRLVFGSILDANPVGVVITFVMVTLSIYTRSIRWRGLVDNRISYAKAFYIIGIMSIMNMLPLRLGEVARTALAAREKIPLITAATSIVVERLMDTVLVLVVLSLVITQVDVLPKEVTQTAPIFGVLAVIAFVVLVTLARYPDFTRNTLKAIEKRLSFLERLPLDAMLEHVLDGLKPLVNGKRFVHAVSWTIISWILTYLVYYIAQVSIGVSPTLFVFGALAFTLSAFTVALPVTVAAIGPFEASIRVAGETFGVNEVISTGLGFLIHALTILAYAVTGTWGFLGMGVALADIMQTETTPPPVETND
jgi:uncharacterized protein (TIRG00374 family)